MASSQKPRNLLVILLDGIGAIFLLFYLILIGPLGVLRGPLLLSRGFLYLYVLTPYGLLARAMRATVDWRMGNFEEAIVQVENIITILEKIVEAHPQRRSRKTVLGDLYSLLARAYMHSGHIDDAMAVVLRAKKSINIERLPGLVDLDAKTAHLVRAGIAAGRLLDSGGMATLFVKADRRPSAASSAEGPGKPNSQSSKSGAGKAKSPSTVPPEMGAKIIPFPTMDQQLH